MSSPDRDQFVSEFIESVRSQLHAAFMSARKEGVSLNKIAKMIGRERDAVSRMLSGKEPMTLRDISDISYALGFDPDIQITLA